MREVHLRRWHLILVLVVFMVWSVGYAVWTDQRIDDAERRISMNSARATDLAVTNARQDKLRSTLLRGLLHADEVSCLRIERLKTQNRIDAQRNYDNLQRNLRLLEVPLTDEIRQLAADELQRDLTRNAPGEC